MNVKLMIYIMLMIVGITSIIIIGVTLKNIYEIFKDIRNKNKEETISEVKENT